MRWAGASLRQLFGVWVLKPRKCRRSDPPELKSKVTLTSRSSAKIKGR